VYTVVLHNVLPEGGLDVGVILHEFYSIHHEVELVDSVDIVEGEELDQRV
jgi:hypothetical protein